MPDEVYRPISLDNTLGEIYSSVNSRSSRFERGVAIKHHAATQSYTVRFSGINSLPQYPSTNLPPSAIPAGKNLYSGKSIWWINVLSIDPTVSNSIDVPWVPSLQSFQPGGTTGAVDKYGDAALSSPVPVLCAVDTRLNYVILGTLRGRSPGPGESSVPTARASKMSTPATVDSAAAPSALTVRGLTTVTTPATPGAPLTIPLPAYTFSRPPVVVASNGSGAKAPYPVLLADAHAVTVSSFDVVIPTAPAGVDICVAWVASS